MVVTGDTIITHIVGRLETIVPVKPGLCMADFTDSVLVTVVVFVIIGKGVEGGSPGVGPAALENDVPLSAVGGSDFGVRQIVKCLSHLAQVESAETVFNVVMGIVAVHTCMTKTGGTVGMDIRFFCGYASWAVTGEAECFRHGLVRQGLARRTVQVVACTAAVMSGI